MILRAPRSVEPGVKSVMVSPSWSKVHLMNNDVAMIVRNVMTTALMVVRSHVTGCGLQRHRLRAALDLGAAVLAQCVDRAARKVGVGEEPGDDLAVVVL